MRTDVILSIGDLVRWAANEYGDRPLWIDATTGRTVTFGEYDATTDRIAAGLIGRGIEPGDRVATWFNNSIELLEAYSGIAKAGAVTVFCNAMLTQREIDYVVDDSSAKLLITDPAEVRELAESDPVALPNVGVDDEAWIGYTSGTTGLPKGASLSHRNPVWVAASIVDSLGLTVDDKLLCCLPMFHSYSVNINYLQPLIAGCSQVVMERFGVPEVIEALDSHDITVWPAVPTMLTYLAHAPEQEGHDFSALRMVVSAGSVLKEQVSADFEAAYGAPIHDGWGSTETGSFATITPAGATRKPGSCGLPMRGSNIRVVDPDGNDVPPGERGELVVRGPNVMSHYLNKPQQTASALADGWYHSGDIAELDADGYVFVVDRLKDLIISSGYNIAPKEIEDVVLSNPAVLDVAVIGLPDEQRGEIPKAYVVLKPGQELGVDDLMAHCRGGLAAYKIPREIEFVEELPKTSSGKVKRYVLREQAG
ncbi:MAG: class I adenylate-forming enzyme family protein [Acidimicrobiales bacterium]|jgi:long-chain acyl-CoA synthetase